MKSLSGLVSDPRLVFLDLFSVGERNCLQALVLVSLQCKIYEKLALFHQTPRKGSLRSLHSKVHKALVGAFTGHSPILFVPSIALKVPDFVKKERFESRRMQNRCSA